jgi:hemerythrin-like domain-containing protein
MQDLFSPHKASFDDPITLLLACHERLRHFTQLIEKLAEYIPQHGVDQQAKGAMIAVIRYFDMAAPLHHADEDEDLFPALYNSCHNETLNETIATLSVAHVHLDSLWQGLKQQLIEVNEGKQTLNKELARTFAEHYCQHVQQEEEKVYPFARQLSANCLALLGQRMQARRGG